MKKGKLVIVSAVIVISIICAIVFLSPTKDERRFNEIIDKYDELYTNRLKSYEDGNIIRCYNQSENISFIAVSQGYEDVIVIYAEFNEKSVEKVKVLYHNETVGYGDLVVEDWFLQRLYLPYEDKLATVKNKKENANEVIAITGATLTSDAVVKAINECAEIMEDIKGEEN